uniref:Pickpocket n=1 Tax=Anopheles dirus TaxID=7168 RepID=A0A182NA42_9DIPT
MQLSFAPCASSAAMRAFSKRSRKAIRSEVFREYCSSSSIHGVRYFDQVERTSCERFWWIVVFLLSMIGCGIMIYKAYVKWNQAPIIVSFSEKTTPVWEVQFPAITICPETKVPSSKLNFTAKMNEFKGEDGDYSNATLDQQVVDQLKAVSQLCNMIFQSNNYYLPFVNGTSEDDVVNILKNLSLSRHEVIGLCIYDNYYTRCVDYMKETITEEGICYSFNMMSEQEIFRKNVLHTDHNYMEDWYDSTEYSKNDTIPLHARGAGLQAGLMLFLKQTKKDMDYMCTGFSQGYKLILHDPNEYPQISKHHIRIPISHEVSIALKPQMIVTSQSAADYSWEKRQCFFNNERYLKFFKVYNQDNCELECITNLTLALCGCVRFSMPRANKTKVCPLHQWHCMFDARSILKQNDNISKIRAMEGIEKLISNCNCLPACSSVHYDVEITQTSLDMEKFIQANKIPIRDSDEFFISTIEIYFKESHFITSKRSELYGLVDFLANCGGLLGLFMGVSILSLLEICYFITIRPFSLRRKKNITSIKRTNEVNSSLLAVVTKVD